jgi:hypothetical protein
MTFLEMLRKIKNLSRDNWSRGRDLESGLPNYEVNLLDCNIHSTVVAYAYRSLIILASSLLTRVKVGIHILDGGTQKAEFSFCTQMMTARVELQLNV